MVRNYKKKGEKGKWNEEDMMEAMKAVNELQMTVYGAAKHYKIPRETLRSRVTGKVSLNAKTGRPTTLTTDEEAEIVETCQVFAEWGFGLRKDDVKAVVADFCRTMRRKNPFKQGMPGDDWWAGFMCRHPALVRRKPQALQMVRAQCSRVEVVNHWFIECLKPTLDSLNLHHHPERVFNVDEVGFPLSGRATSVLVKKGMKSPQSLIPGSGRDNITVQVCCSASGELLPPYVIYSGQRLQYNCTSGGPLGTRYSCSANGWMTGSNFIDWLKSVFIASLSPQHPPVLLILDGHTSHISYEVRTLARDNNVHLLKLPPHLTHLLQPLDLAVFKPMKSAWDVATADFIRRERRAITRRDFPCLLNTIWRKGYKPENATGRFRRAGISSYDATVIPNSALHYSEPFHQPCSNVESSTSSLNISEQTSNTEAESLVSLLPEQCDANLGLQHHQQEAVNIQGPTTVETPTPSPPSNNGSTNNSQQL